MTVQSWRTLRTKKYQLSLRLFLLLNAVSALFTLVFPLFAVKAVSVPALLILAASTLLLAWHGMANMRIKKLIFLLFQSFLACYGHYIFF